MNRVTRHFAAAMKLMMEVTYRSLPDSAEWFADREVTTVLYITKD